MGNTESGAEVQVSVNDALLLLGRATAEVAILRARLARQEQENGRLVAQIKRLSEREQGQPEQGGGKESG